MKYSPTIKAISTALLSAQKTIGAAKKGSTNPFFHSNYADLGSVMEACKEALNDNGITCLQPVEDMTVETVLLHESGEWISGSTPIVLSKQDPQALGSAISYARRYGLQSMLFIPAEDDDAEKAMNRTETVQNNTGVSTPISNAAITRKCTRPACNGTQIYREGISKTTGKPWKRWACDINESHIDWVNEGKKFESRHPYDGETIPVEEYEA